MAKEINFFKETSVGIPGGGDSHIHPWDNKQGFTVTTRLPGDQFGIDGPGGLAIHNNFPTPTAHPPRPWYDR